MPFQPMNYGNVLAQGEQIKNARYARDPNSPRNQLLQAQINNLNTPSGPSLGQYNPRDYTADSWSQFVQTEDPTVLKRFATLRPAERGGVPGLVNVITGEFTPGSTLEQETGAEEALAAAQRRGTLTQDLEFKPQIESATMASALDAEMGLGGGTSRADVAESLADVENKAAVTKKYKLDDVDSVIKAQNKLGVMMTQDRKLDKVIDLSQNGANTGPIMRYLPTLTAETAELEQLQNEMGLDVIGSVTFGALSKGELDLSLVTAMPTNLDGPDLVQWAKDKQAANKKLAGYLMEQIKFMRAGGTRAEWMEKVQSRGGINAAAEETPVDTYEQRKAKILGTK